MASRIINKDLYIVTKSITFDSNGEFLGWLDEAGIAPDRNYTCIAAYPQDWGPTTMTFDKHGFLELSSSRFAGRTISFIFVLIKAFS